MIKKDEEKKMYDATYVGELVTCMDALDAQYDLFISADVLIYVGSLEALFESLKNHASDKALFVFSTEHLEGQGYLLQYTCRYTHSLECIRSVAAKSG